MKFNHKAKSLAGALGLDEEQIINALDISRDCLSVENATKASEAIKNLVESDLTREELCIVLAVVYKNASHEMAMSEVKRDTGMDFEEFMKKFINPKK